MIEAPLPEVVMNTVTDYSWNGLVDALNGLPNTVCSLNKCNISNEAKKERKEYNFKIFVQFNYGNAGNPYLNWEKLRYTLHT